MQAKQHLHTATSQCDFVVEIFHSASSAAYLRALVRGRFGHTDLYQNMSCVRIGSLVECIKNGEVVLEAVQDIQEGDVLHDPFSVDGVSFVDNVIHEFVSDTALYSLFGLQCAGPQLVLYNGMWSRVEHLRQVLPEPSSNQIMLIGFILSGSCNLRVDGVICRGLRREDWEAANLKYLDIALKMENMPSHRSTHGNVREASARNKA